MKLKEVKPGMAVKCKTKEEAIALWMWFYENGYVRKEHPEDGLDNFLSCFSCSLFYISESINSWGTFSEGIADVKKVQFSDLVIPELSAEEALLAYDKMCKENYCCNDCPIYGILGHECAKRMDGHITEIIDAIKKWKADREKKEPEIETFYNCRIMQIFPDRSRRCVHEEEAKADPYLPYGGESSAAEEILKRYCMEHDGEFIAVHEVVSRVKAVE